MRKLILAAVVGTAFALAGCSEKTEDAAATTADAAASDAAMAADTATDAAADAMGAASDAATDAAATASGAAVGAVEGAKAGADAARPKRRRCNLRVFAKYTKGATARPRPFVWVGETRKI